MINFISGASQQLPAQGGNQVYTIKVSGVTYAVHKFTSSGTFTAHKNLTCDYLVVAGGGSAAAGWDDQQVNGILSPNSAIGGAGAGGVIQASSSFSVGNFTVLVGAGGSSVSTNFNYVLGNNGSDSSIQTIASASGGGTSGTSGASGGGGTHRTTTSIVNPSPGGSGIVGQGFNGGTSSNWGAGTAFWRGGGGGGSNGVGGNGVYGGNAGSGGVGIQSSIDGVSKYYAGGGGGAARQNGRGGAGGLGGGGAGFAATLGCIGCPPPGPGANGSQNTGGGAGGGTSRTGASGGSGIVIIRYPI